MRHPSFRRAVTALSAAALALAMVAPATLADSDARPLEGMLVGTATAATDATCPIALRTLSEGMGDVSHLGAATMTSSHCTPNPPFGPSTGPILRGAMTMTAASGDRLFATYHGTVDPTTGVEGAVIRGTTHFDISGGTGRFEGARGSGDMSFQGTLHLTAPMTLTWWITGTIGY